MTRPSDPAAGFTLLELLVVLTLLALLAAALPRLLPRTEGAELEARARAVAGLLERSRASAITTARAVDVLIDVEAHRLASTADAAGEAIPDWVELEATTARELVERPGLAVIRFFADGSATGGRIELRWQARRFSIDVAWLTGAVRLAEAGP